MALFDNLNDKLMKSTAKRLEDANRRASNNPKLSQEQRSEYREKADSFREQRREIDERNKYSSFDDER